MGVVLGDRRAKRWVAAAAAAAMVAPAAVLVAAWPSQAAAAFAVSRIGGPDRYDTARQVAEAAFPGGAATVILANGLNYPDALAGSYLAGTKGIPVLLTNPASLSSAASQAMQELKTKNVTVLGGNLAVSDNVMGQLAATASTSSAGGNLVATRLSGPTRYETAASIATSGGTIGTISGQPAAIVASGENFPDALAAGPIAVASHIPILLTNKDHEAPQTEAALQQLGVKQILLLGGTFAIADAVANSLAASGSRTVTRIAGQDRTDTAAQVYEYALRNFGFSNKSVFLANGTTFPAPDALSGGPLAGKAPTGILLASDADNLGQFTTAEVQSHASTLTSGTILGLSLAISASGQSAFAAAAGGAANTSGGITLDKTVVSPGDTINGTITNPSTVSSLTVDGCGNSNKALTVGSGGAFSFTIPVNQPGGQCVLTFTVVYNNGTATGHPTFTISVNNPALAFQAPSLVSVTITRGAPPTAFDTAAFKFNEPLAAHVPNPSSFFLYRASGAFAKGVNNPTLSTDTWTVSFPPGSADNVTLGGVAPAAVTNVSGMGNFPGSVATSGASSVPLTTLEPDLTAVGIPTSTTTAFFTDTFTFDKTFTTAQFPATTTTKTTSSSVSLQLPSTVAPGATLTGTVASPGSVTGLTVGGCGITAGQAVPFDPTTGALQLAIPATGVLPASPSDPANAAAHSCSLDFTVTPAPATQPHFAPNVGYLYCAPTADGVTKTSDAKWQVVNQAGQVTPAATSGGAFSAESSSTIVNGGTCPAASAMNVTFQKDLTGLVITAGNVQAAAVFNTTLDATGNPMESAFTGAAPSWPILGAASESPGAPGGSATNVIFSFRTQQVSPPAGGYQSAAFRLIRGDGTTVASSFVGPRSGDPSSLIATFNSSDVSNAVGASVAGSSVTGSTAGTSFASSSVPLSPDFPPNSSQVELPQLLKVDMSTNSSGGNVVVYTFDKNLTSAPLGYFLYTTDGVSTQAGGSPTISANTATFTCTIGLLGLGTACTSYTTATVNAAVAGGVFDLTGANPSASPPASVQATINGNLAGTTTTTSTSTTSTTAH